MSRPKNADRAIRKLLSMASPEAIVEIGQALKQGGELIENEAKVSITTGSASFDRHVPSLPGEPPNNDTGVLAGNIETTQESPLRVLVSSNAPYSEPLEFGTSKMAARPFMRPAAEKHRADIQRFMVKAIKTAVGKAVKD